MEGKSLLTQVTGDQGTRYKLKLAQVARGLQQPRATCTKVDQHTLIMVCAVLC